MEEMTIQISESIKWSQNYVCRLCPCLLVEKEVHIETKKKKTNDEIKAIWEKKENIFLGAWREKT